MSVWEEFPLEEVIDKFIDYRGKTPKKTTSGIPLITAKIVKRGFIQEPNEFIAESDYDSWMRRGIPKVGDVVLTTEAPLGEVAQINTCKIIALAQRIITLRGKPDRLNNSFLKYALQSNAMQYRLTGRASGSTVQGIKSSELKKVLLPLPRLTEQENIAEILSSLDEKIELNRKQNRTLESIAQALFKRWFVEFEFPDENGQPYKSSGGTMQPSELGEIPVGWEAVPIGDAVETLGGGTPKTTIEEYWTDGDIEWYSPTDLTKANALYSLGSGRKITQSGLAKSAAKLFPSYSLMMTSRATIGVIAINRKPACTNQGFITLIPNSRFSLYQLHGWLLQHMLIIHSKSSGTTFKEISRGTFRDFDILRTNVGEAYADLVKPLYRKMEGNIVEIDVLTKMRDSLLPKLMSGELRVTQEIAA